MTRLLVLLFALGLAGNTNAETVAVVGAKVHTVGPAGTIDDATILIEDGRIAAVGADIAVPAGATTLVASNKIITPGLFSPVGQLGLGEIGQSADPNDASQVGDRFTASFDVADAYNRRSTLIPIARIEGITRAAITPTPGWSENGEAAHTFSGLAALVNLGDDAVLDTRGAAMVVTLGENGAYNAGGSRAAAWLVLRNALAEALDYRDHKEDVERGMRREYDHSIDDLEALQNVIAGATPLLVNVDRASDIEVLIELVNEYSVRAIISGGAEAWMHADALAAANISVIMRVTGNLPANFDRINIQRGAANILAEAGVRFALNEINGETHNARNLTQVAGNAVADGLDWDAALRAITLSPAEIYGVGDIVGSIEPGKAADLVIWPGDPFELSNYPDQVLINGVTIPMHSRQTLLRDRYLQMDSGKPPAYRD